jgi:ergothioneine biosynthesis protein EgtB
VYRRVRRQTEDLCRPLEIDDYGLQSMPDASPIKWHLAHTTWFFETFVLAEQMPSYRKFHPTFEYLFNSYYHAVGPRWARPQRGLLSRPTVAEVFRYREHVDEQMSQLLTGAEAGPLAATIVIGLHHEQQHQELMLTDLKHGWSFNPLAPVYRPAARSAPADAPRLKLDWQTFDGGIRAIGHQGEHFAFDNESPRHRVLLQPFQIANRLVSAGDYLEFMADGAYERPQLWLSEGWATVQEQGWSAPLYWEQRDGDWSTFTLAGRQPIDPAAPVCHVSYYEADAFARWAGARLPTEAEWETAAGTDVAGHFVESGNFHPAATPAHDDAGPVHQLYGDVWQWTASPYVGYPGYRAPAGALGEYNSKFMCNQFVLRGASCATPRSHARLTYRNFFPPQARWQFAGLRLAKDIASC